MSFKGGNPIYEKEAFPLKGATPSDALAAREANLEGGESAQGIMKMGKGLLDLGEAFGIDKKDVGKMLVKSIFTGKLDFPGMTHTTTQRKKLEVAVDQVIKIAWTFFGIFMIFKVFTVVVGVVT